MKKKLILTLCLALSIFCTGCNSKSQKNNNSVDNGYEDIIENTCVSEFKTQDEMAEHIISHKDDIFPLFFEHETQKASPDNLKFFSWGNVIDGYELENVEQAGEKITMTYENKADATAQPINFIWKFTAEGDVYIQNKKMIERLTEMPEMKGYYYTIAQNEDGKDFCDIYWPESGYAFELQAPTSWVDEKNQTILLNVTEYSLSK